jgi:hypothetical protein
VAHKNFAKIGILNTLKKSILSALPQKIKENKETNILSL